MNGAHTPGPWKFVWHNDHGAQITFACVAMGDEVKVIGHGREQVANARLIAAAPDLLDALTQIVECEKRRAADLRHREAWKLVKFSEGRIAQAEAAIAKATGAAQ